MLTRAARRAQRKMQRTLRQFDRAGGVIELVVVTPRTMPDYVAAAVDGDASAGVIVQSISRWQEHASAVAGGILRRRETAGVRGGGAIRGTELRDYRRYLRQVRRR